MRFAPAGPTETNRVFQTSFDSLRRYPLCGSCPCRRFHVSLSSLPPPLRSHELGGGRVSGARQQFWEGASVFAPPPPNSSFDSLIHYANPLFTASRHRSGKNRQRPKYRCPRIVRRTALRLTLESVRPSTQCLSLPAICQRVLRRPSGSHTPWRAPQKGTSTSSSNHRSCLGPSDSYVVRRQNSFAIFSGGPHPV